MTRKEKFLRFWKKREKKEKKKKARSKKDG